MDRLTRGLAIVAAAVSGAVGAGVQPHAVRAISADASSTSLPRSCLRLTPLRHGRIEAVIRRGRLLRSVTLRRVGGSRIYGCDSTGARDEGRLWCNVETARLRSGRVTDPRLGLLCTTRRHQHVASAWITPMRRTRVLVVLDGRRRDRYRVVGTLPVRVAVTHGIAYDRASAVFVFAEYGARGRLVRKARIVARVAG